VYELYNICAAETEGQGRHNIDRCMNCTRSVLQKLRARAGTILIGV